MNIERFVLIAFLIEAIVNMLLQVYVAGTEKPWYQCINWKLLLALFVSEIVSFGFSLNLMAALGFTEAAPWFGIVLTGLLISRGSNFIHDLGKFVNNLKQQTTQQIAASTGAVGSADGCR